MATRPGGKSQMGCLVLFGSPKSLEQKSAVSVLDWKSARSPRVTRSTLASEANAMDETVDRATYANVFVSELLYGGAGKTPRRGDLFQLRALRQVQCTDCKSLYDAVISPNVSASEKRTMIAIRSVQDFIKEDECHWVPTEVMWADVLTKEDRNLCLAFQGWMKAPYVMLVDEKKILQCELFSDGPSSAFGFTPRHSSTTCRAPALTIQLRIP